MIALFFHAWIPDQQAIDILCGQMAAIKDSGLEAAAFEIHVGYNGGEIDGSIIRSVIPKKATLYHWKAGASEIPTLSLLREWIRDKGSWQVCYLHTKGVSHPGEQSYANWRQRMENACVWNWKRCVADLERGADAVGCHWLTPERFPGAVTSPFFGGTFWWARSEYLMQLPPLPADTHANRYEAESWIGRRRPYPQIVDYFPGWP